MGVLGAAYYAGWTDVGTTGVLLGASLYLPYLVLGPLATGAWLFREA